MLKTKTENTPQMVICLAAKSLADYCVITVLGWPINKIPGPDGLRSFLFAVHCKQLFAGTANKKSLPAVAGRDFVEVSGGM